MSRVTSVRERVHEGYWDTLIRVHAPELLALHPEVRVPVFEDCFFCGADVEIGGRCSHCGAKCGDRAPYRSRA